jgi:hypothetical protein
MRQPALKSFRDCAAQRNRFEGMATVPAGTYRIKCTSGSIGYRAGKYRYVYVRGGVPDKNVEACLSAFID